MNPIEQSIIAARRRIFFGRWLTSVGWLLVWGFCALGLMLLLGRLLAWHTPGWVSLAILAPIVGVPPIVAWWGLPDRETIATLIDHRLGLKDRLRSALYASSIHGHPFAERVINEAERAASGAPVWAAFPIRMDRVWVWVLLAGFVFALTAVSLPQMDLMGFAEAKENQHAQQADTRAIRQELLQTASVIKDIVLPKPESHTPPNLEAADALQQLSQITENDLRDPKQRRATASSLSRLQSELEETAQQQQELFEQLQNTMSRLNTQAPGPAGPFAEAVRRGDFKTAQQETEALAQAIESMPETDRQLLREQIENLAQQLHRETQQHPAHEAETPPPINEVRQAPDPAPEPNQEDLPQTPPQLPLQDTPTQQPETQQNRDPSPTQQADQKKPSQKRRSNQNRVREYLEKLSKSMKQASETLKNPPNNPQGQPQPPQPPQQPQPQKQALRKLGEQLSDLAEAEEDLQRIRRMKRQAQQTLHRLLEESGQGRRVEAADDSNPLAPQPPIKPHGVHAADGREQDQAKVIAWWLDNRTTQEGSRVGFERAASQAKHDAEQAVTDNRIPREYHQAVREYFNQMPQDPQQIQTHSEEPY